MLQLLPIWIDTERVGLLNPGNMYFFPIPKSKIATKSAMEITIKRFWLILIFIIQALSLSVNNKPFPFPKQYLTFHLFVVDA